MRTQDGSREMRWGFPSSKKALLDAATTHVNSCAPRGRRSASWSCCGWSPTRKRPMCVTPPARTGARGLVPRTARSCPSPRSAGPTRSAACSSRSGTLGAERPLAFFAGLWTPWTKVRKIKEGEVSCELFGFLPTDANAEGAAQHSKAMPVILTQPAEWDLWLRDAPWPESPRSSGRSRRQPQRRRAQTPPGPARPRRLLIDQGWKAKSPARRTGRGVVDQAALRSLTGRWR